MACTTPYCHREAVTMAPKTAVKEERWAAVQCAYCRGKGKDPFGVPHPKSNCCVARGREPFECKNLT